MLKSVVVAGGVVVAAAVVDMTSKYEYLCTAAAQLGIDDVVVVAGCVEPERATI